SFLDRGPLAPPRPIASRGSLMYHAVRSLSRHRRPKEGKTAFLPRPLARRHSFSHEKGPTPTGMGPLRKVSWRRPALPLLRRSSTLGAGGLNDRVRDGNGCFPPAIATRKQSGARHLQNCRQE